MFLLLILLLFPLQVYCLSFTEKMHTQRVRATSSSAEQSRGIIRYAANCSGSVDRLLKVDGTPERYVEIVELEKVSSMASENELKVEYDADTDILEFTYLTIRALLRRRAGELFEKKAREERIICCLAAGLAYRQAMTMRSYGGATVELDYQAARVQFSDRHFPDVKKLCASPVPPDFPVLFQLYAMHCDLFLRCLESIPGKGKSIAIRLLEMEAFGRDAGDSVEFVVGGLLPAGVTLQGWYERQVLIACNRIRVAENWEDIESRVHELESVSIVDAGGGGATQVPIDNVPEAFSDFKPDKAALMRRQNQFLALRNDAPPLLRPPLNMFARSLGLLVNGDVKGFRSEIALARAEFAKCLKRQRDIELALVEYEKETIPIERRFRPFIEIMERYFKLHDEIFVW